MKSKITLCIGTNIVDFEYYLVFYFPSENVWVPIKKNEDPYCHPYPPSYEINNDELKSLINNLQESLDKMENNTNDN